MAVIEPQATPFSGESSQESSPVLRGQDGDTSHAPAFLGRPAAAAAAAEVPAAEGGEEAKKPRRRRAPRSFEGGEGAPAGSGSEES